MSSVRGFKIKNLTYYFLNNVISIKHFDLDNIKIDEKSHKNIFIQLIGYVAPNSLKPLHIAIKKANGYKDERYEKNYLTLVHSHNDKNKLCSQKRAKKKLIPGLKNIGLKNINKK